MIPLLIFVLVMVIFLISEFRRPGAVRGRSLLEAGIGFLGWFVVNTLLWVWVLKGESGTIILNPFRLLPLLVTIAVTLVLVFAGWRYLASWRPSSSMRSACCSSLPRVRSWTNGAGVSWLCCLSTYIFSSPGFEFAIPKSSLFALRSTISWGATLHCS